MTGNAEEALYLFCFSFSNDVDAIEASGVEEGRKLFTRRYGEIVAVLSRVHLDEYTGEGSESKMRDLEWIGPRAVRHQQTIEQVMRSSPVLPVPFGTIFRSEGSLERLVARHRERITAFLRRGMRTEEWAVKGFVDRNRAMESVRSEGIADGTLKFPGSPGARYLFEKRLLAILDNRLDERLNAAAKEILERLEKTFSEYSERTVLPDGGDEQMFCNWAFLVKKEKVPALREEIERVNMERAQAGYWFRYSGPWPPYSFAPALE